MSATAIELTIGAIADDFALFSDWEERYGYVLELGRALPGMPADARTEQARVRGCASQVWMTSARDPATGALTFQGDSDAHIVRGLIAILLKIFSNRAPQEILSVDPQAVFTRLGLSEALTAQRANGMAAMIKRIQADAAAAL